MKVADLKDVLSSLPDNAEILCAGPNEFTSNLTLIIDDVSKQLSTIMDEGGHLTFILTGVSDEV